MDKKYVRYDVDYMSEIYNGQANESFYDDRELNETERKNAPNEVERDGGHVESHYVEYTDGIATGVATVTEPDEIADISDFGEHYLEPAYLDKSIIGKSKEEVEKILSNNVANGERVSDEHYYAPKYYESVSSNEEFRKAKIEEIRRKGIQEGRALSDNRFYESFHNRDKLQDKAASLDVAVSRVERKAQRKGEKIELSADDIAKIRFNEYKKMKKEHV